MKAVGRASSSYALNEYKVFHRVVKFVMASVDIQNATLASALKMQKILVEYITLETSIQGIPSLASPHQKL